jgi:predicted enzyme related to lactoylglutathione lyase
VRSEKRAKRPPRAASRATPPARAAARTSKKAASRPGAKAKRPMFQKIAFTLFAISDATRARGFYEDVLGLTRGLASPEGVWTEYDLPGGGCLALFRHPDPKHARTPGGASVAFEVANLDALNERLRAAGVVYQGEMVHGPHCRMSNILDSEGNTIILHQLTSTKG